MNDNQNLIISNIRLIKKLINIFTRNFDNNIFVSIDKQDFLSDSICKLLEAVNKYHPKRGAVTTFIWHVMCRHAFHYLASCCQFKISMEIYKNFLIGTSKKRRHFHFNNLVHNKFISLNAEVNNIDFHCSYEEVTSPKEQSDDLIDLNIDLKKTLKILNERELHIVTSSSGVDKYLNVSEKKTLAQLARMYNVSRESIRQTRAKALSKMKSFYLTGKYEVSKSCNFCKQKDMCQCCTLGEKNEFK